MIPGTRETCFVCQQRYGECTCPEIDSMSKDGFEHEGMWIVDPRISECGRFFVDPVLCYGQAYLDWVKGRSLKR